MTGQTVSHYEILDRLGAGGMGVVYRARDLRLQRLVAVKFLPPELTRDPQARDRFMQEARSASSLDHPNICTIYDIDETADGGLFMAMALYDGITLNQRLARGPIPIEEAIDFGLQLAQGLHKAHGAGIVHRDIKPANLMLTSDGVVKILDFGVAKLVGVTGLTGAGTALGTISYMAPEQTRGEDVDARTDLWAAGAVLYEAITGQPPFAGDTPIVVATAIQHVEPKGLTSLRSGVPMVLERVVLRALRKDPNERFQTAADLAAEFRILKRDSDGSGHRPGAVPSAPAPAAHPSIAVLPFANTGGDPENEFFSDGITEEIISALTRVPSLDVVARTSAFAFKGKSLDVRTIGNQLGVTAVLEGSVRRAGNRLRITAQLINVADGFHLWSDRFDREIQDIFAIQDEIAQTIVKTLTSRLVPRPTPVASEPDVEAYTLYLKGRYHWNRRTNDSMRAAASYFEQALTRDPSYALAHAGVADCYALLGWVAFGGMAPHDAFPKARRAAERALELDPALAEAHNSLGWTRLVYDWDWASAEQSFARALELNPRYAMAHAWYAMHLAWTGRMDQGLIHASRAQELEPLSLIIHTLAGWVQYFAGDYEQSIAHCQRTLELDPGYARAHLGLGWAYQAQGKLALAMTEFERGVERSGRGSRFVAALGCLHAQVGDDAKARACLAELDAQAQKQYVSPADWAVVLVAQGEFDEAFKYLDRACEERSGALVFLRVDPEFARVAGDPRFSGLIARMKFPGRQGRFVLLS